MVSLARWLETGNTLDVDGRQLFYRVDGDGPWTTFLHGFPTNSFDWHKVAGQLPTGCRRLYVDHLGFGASSAPRGHKYSFAEQIDLLLALWEHHGVSSTVLVAHDYSVSIVQEILARRLEGTWEGPELRAVLLFNGGLFYSVQQPLGVQKLLRTPILGAVAGRFASKSTFVQAMNKICGRPLTAGELEAHWQSMQAARSAVHALSRYHMERKRHEGRWTAALAACDVPLRLAWGLKDPVSGAAMLDAARDKVRPAITEWSDLGHYPMLEDPHRVAQVVTRTEAYGVRL